MRIYRISQRIEQVRYFHGSYDSLPVGTILTPGRGSSFMRGLNDDIMDSPLILESFRPPEFISRNRAVFMTDNIDDIDNAGGATDHIYLVNPLGKVDRHDLSWMTQIDIIMSDNSYSSSLGIKHSTIEDKEINDSIKEAALNYWNSVPHTDESVWEYLTTSAEIIEEVFD